MGKKRKSSDDELKKKKKKKKKDAKKKRKRTEKTTKKDKKKTKDAKKAKKVDSTSSSSDGSGSTSIDEKIGKDGKKKRHKDDKEVEALILDNGAQQVSAKDLPLPEEGILRFEFYADEVGPLGLRFSAGYPPLILEVHADTFAGRRGVPPNFEVHAINGLALVPLNRDVVMNSLKARPVTLDLRPQGWKPREKLQQIQRKRQLEEAEKQVRIQEEEERRAQVARDAAERAEREAQERAERQEEKRRVREEQAREAREARQQQKLRVEEFERILARDSEPLRAAAQGLMEAAYGTDVRVEGRRGLPLRMLTRRKEVAWLWAGEVQELIGGGIFDPGDTWS